jgi:hypothetical protein
LGLARATLAEYEKVDAAVAEAIKEANPAAAAAAE